jgi:hypothetical protein
LIPELLDPACEYVVQEHWTEYTEFLEAGCETSCTDSSLLTVVPSDATILFADCGGYWRLVASVSGPLKPLLRAPAGTALSGRTPPAPTSRRS